MNGKPGRAMIAVAGADQAGLALIPKRLGEYSWG